MHKHRWQIWEEQFETEYTITHLKKNSQSVDWKAVASFQTANIRIYTPSQQQVMGKLFFDHFLSQSSSLIFPLGKRLVLILIVLYSQQLW